MNLKLSFQLPILALLLSLPLLVRAQGATTNPQDGLPRVFLIGEQEDQFEDLLSAYPQSLLEACEGDMGKAFERWIVMAAEIEAYAEKAEFDILGVKAWFHVFFDKTGRIDHIAFHLKPESKNIELDELKDFLEEFAGQYQFPLINDKNYQNYSSVQFPLLYKGENN
ncbi:MAG: hypothetical protein KDC44_12695 [Phaeodactylibacter sp.]|nr:hypothetical protein [Phaeodactylibacter sp.]